MNMKSNTSKTFILRKFSNQYFLILYQYQYFRLKDKADFLINASIFGDPSKAFYIYFPIFLALNRKTGIGYLKAVIFCEWMNQMLKW